LAQVLNLRENELDILAPFMGNNIKVSLPTSKRIVPMVLLLAAAIKELSCYSAKSWLHKDQVTAFKGVYSS